MTQRVVISERFGGFGLSEEAQNALMDHGWVPESQYDHGDDLTRDDPRLLAVVDELGAAASSGGFASIVVVELPDDVKWHIHEYDGYETVHEDHRSWTSRGEEANCGAD